MRALRREQPSSNEIASYCSRGGLLNLNVSSNHSWSLMSSPRALHAGNELELRARGERDKAGHARLLTIRHKQRRSAEPKLEHQFQAPLVLHM